MSYRIEKNFHLYVEPQDKYNKLRVEFAYHHKDHSHFFPTNQPLIILATYASDSNTRSYKGFAFNWYVSAFWGFKQLYHYIGDRLFAYETLSLRKSSTSNGIVSQHRVARDYSYAINKAKHIDQFLIDYKVQAIKPISKIPGVKDTLPKNTTKKAGKAKPYQIDIAYVPFSDLAASSPCAAKNRALSNLDLAAEAGNIPNTPLVEISELELFSYLYLINQDPGLVEFQVQKQKAANNIIYT